MKSLMLMLMLMSMLFSRAASAIKPEDVIPTSPPDSLNDMLYSIRDGVDGVDEAVTGTRHVRRLITQAMRYARKARWLEKDEQDCFELTGLQRALAKLAEIAQQSGVGTATSEIRRLDARLRSLNNAYCQGHKGDVAQTAWNKCADHVADFRRVQIQQASVTLGAVQGGAWYGVPAAVGATPRAAVVEVALIAGVLLLPESLGITLPLVERALSAATSGRAPPAVPRPHTACKSTEVEECESVDSGTARSCQCIQNPCDNVMRWWNPLTNSCSATRPG